MEDGGSGRLGEEREGAAGSSPPGLGLTASGLGSFGAKEGASRFSLFLFRLGTHLD